MQQVPASSSAPNMDPPALQEFPTEASFQIFTNVAIDINRRKYSIGAVVLNHLNQYKIPLKAPTKSNFKRNPFGLSNSFPLEELPLAYGNVDQSLAVADVAKTLKKSKGKAITGAKRSAFIPHSGMVGDSLRNILKRARGGPVINEVSSVSVSPSDQAGVVEQPHPKKMILMGWNARGVGSPRAF
uniref:Uncharacterized protein n=1 Tax=Cannabis sativa TaxID=3483 RepID=A0A803PZJ4_CANSA